MNSLTRNNIQLYIGSGISAYFCSQAAPNRTFFSSSRALCALHKSRFQMNCHRTTPHSSSYSNFCDKEKYTELSHWCQQQKSSKTSQTFYCLLAYKKKIKTTSTTIFSLHKSSLWQSVFFLLRLFHSSFTLYIDIVRMWFFSAAHIFCSFVFFLYMFLCGFFCTRARLSSRFIEMKIEHL